MRRRGRANKIDNCKIWVPTQDHRNKGNRDLQVDIISEHGEGVKSTTGVCAGSSGGISFMGDALTCYAVPIVLCMRNPVAFLVIWAVARIVVERPIKKPLGKGWISIDIQEDIVSGILGDFRARPLGGNFYDGNGVPKGVAVSWVSSWRTLFVDFLALFNVVHVPVGENKMVTGFVAIVIIHDGIIVFRAIIFSLTERCT